MTETPEQRVARLEAELAQAKVDALQKELAAARSGVQEESADPDPPRGPEHLAPPVLLGKPAGDWDPPASTWLPDSGNSTDPADLGDSGIGAPSAGRLAPAPREVPRVFQVVLFPFRFWTLFAIFMISVTPLALWIFVPIAGVIVIGLAFLVLAYRMLRRRHLCHVLMKWGDVATVTGTRVLSTGTYYSGTTYQNVRLAQAHGWKVTRRWYSGPGYKTKVRYQVGAGTGTLIIRGLPYEDGVILADPRQPKRALCVSSFPYDLEPDHSGNWVGTLPSRVLASSTLMTLIVLGWTAGMLLLFIHAVHVEGPLNTH